jgi:hypothetical protein
MNDLANRARALHRERGMTAEHIRHRSGLLDDNNDPYIPVATIRDWLGEEGAGDNSLASDGLGTVSHRSISVLRLSSDQQSLTARVFPQNEPGKHHAM